MRRHEVEKTYASIRFGIDSDWNLYIGHYFHM